MRLPALPEYYERSLAASTAYEFPVVRPDGTRPVASTNGVMATTPATGTEYSVSYANMQQWSPLADGADYTASVTRFPRTRK